MSMKNDKTAAVAGGTGRAGSAYVRALLEAGYGVRASHTPGRAETDLPPGAEPVEAELTRPGDAARLVEGASALFIAILGRGDDAVAREARIARTLIDAADAAGVEPIVYTSVHRADERTGVPHFEVKAEVEEAIRESGLRHTILRPATFMDGIDAPWIRTAVQEEGVLRSPIALDAPISYIATDDLARIGVRALENPRLDGATLPLGGPDALRYRDILPILSDLTGRDVDYRQLPIEAVKARLGPGMAAMIELFNREGFRVDTEAVLARHKIDIPLTPLRRFLEGAGWGQRGQ